MFYQNEKKKLENITVFLKKEKNKETGEKQSQKENSFSKIPTLKILCGFERYVIYAVKKYITNSLFVDVIGILTKQT